MPQAIGSGLVLGKGPSVEMGAVVAHIVDFPQRLA
jgi:H+/Cl- antiporter ClcA